MSDQSRSMLALFQESAIRVMDKEDGVLVPFRSLIHISWASEIAEDHDKAGKGRWTV